MYMCVCVCMCAYVCLLQLNRTKASPWIQPDSSGPALAIEPCGWSADHMYTATILSNAGIWAQEIMSHVSLTCTCARTHTHTDTRTRTCKSAQSPPLFHDTIEMHLYQTAASLSLPSRLTSLALSMGVSPCQ